MNMPVFCKHVQSVWNTYLQRSCVCCFCVQCLDIIRIFSFCFIAQRITRSARYHLWQVDISCSSPCLRFSYLLLVCAILVIHHCSSLGLKFFLFLVKTQFPFGRPLTLPTLGRHPRKHMTHVHMSSMLAFLTRKHVTQFDTTPPLPH